MSFPSEPISNKLTLLPWNLIDASDYATKETDYWSFDDDDGLYDIEFFDVALNSEEGIFVENIITKTSNALIIKEITRIQNPYLMAMFLLKKEEMINEHGSNVVQSRFVLHGTKSSNIDSIARENFSLEEVKRKKFGPGVYFTNCVKFASMFSGKNKNKTVIVANILQAISCGGDPNMNYPPAGADTTITKDEKNRNIIVKYDDNSFYPAYKVRLELL